MTLKEFAQKYNLDAQELLDLLIFEGFPIQEIDDEIDTRLTNYLLEYTSKKAKSKKQKLELENAINIQARKKDYNSLQKQKIDTTRREIVLKSMSVQSLAKESGINLSECIHYFIKKKKLYSINHILTKDEVNEFARENNLLLSIAQPEGNEASSVIVEKKTHNKEKKDSRNPVIVVVGHVDHGKTTLLDTIRKKSVAASEKGGITQHVGAYEIEYQGKNITFLDTPGHEAFTSLRMRGITIADIGILVIASDDGIKPQTVESINMLKKMNLHIIVVITKIDKTNGKNYDDILSALTTYHITPEAWGGDVPVIFVSAKTEAGIPELLETINLTAEIHDIKTNLQGIATGYLLETRLEKGKGFVANILLEQGILKVGDTFYAGNVWGKLSLVYNFEGKTVNQLYPGKPYIISGFNEMPLVGDILVAASLKEAKEKALYNKLKSLEKENILPASEKKTYPLIIKADVISSLQAIKQKIVSYQEQKGNFYFPSIVYSNIGDITEHDLTTSIHTNAIIYLFHIKHNPTQKIKEIIKKNNIVINSFDIIYHLFEHIEHEIKEEKNKKPELKKIGEIEVLKLFNIKGVGKIIGFKVTHGIVKQGSIGSVIRENKKIAEGQIKTLQKDKIACKELSKGNEGALNIPSVQDIIEGDIIQIFYE